MNKKLSLAHLVFLICLVVFALSTHAIASEKDGLLHVYLLDVGQGDSIFIETPDGMQILIDGGPGERVVGELSEVMPFYDRSIDVVILTHPHADHVSGLIEVLERYQVDNIIQTGIDYNSSEFKAWQKTVSNEKAVETEAIIGKDLNLGEDIVLRFIFPFESFSGLETKNPNDVSIVALLEYGNFEILLSGDMEDKEERQLLAAGVNVDADVLKVGHHGSKTSTIQVFLDAVSPMAGLISVGANNRYGHPHEEVIERLENSSIPYYRTDVNGRIEVRSDGEHFSINTEK